MTESILTSVKQFLGPAEAYDHFDPAIIMEINTALARLRRLGVGPSEGFVIHDATAVWSDFTQDIDEMADIKSYVCYKVKLTFDPPTSSAYTETLKENIRELEFLLNVDAETPV